MLNPTTDIVQLMVADIDSWSRLLKKFLVENDVTIDSVKFTEIIKAVLELKVKKVTEDYYGLVTDSNGYIIKKYILDEFINVKDAPQDIDGGYYKIVNKELVLDEERQRQLEEV